VKLTITISLALLALTALGAETSFIPDNKMRVMTRNTDCPPPTTNAPVPFAFTNETCIKAWQRCCGVGMLLYFEPVGGHAYQVQIATGLTPPVRWFPYATIVWPENVEWPYTPTPTPYEPTTGFTSIQVSVQSRTVYYRILHD
jgi:hypothetical protein